MLKCMIILACLVHKAPFNVLPRCPKVASLYMHSRVRKCPEQCQTCSNAWKISTHSWVDINTMWFGGFQTIQIFWTITNTLSTFHLNIYSPPSPPPPPPLHTNTKEKQKKNMIKIIKNNSNLFKCHSFMHLYFQHHHLFQEAHIHRQSHNTNFRFLFFLIQIHYGLSKRFFSFIYRIFFALIEFWFTLNVLSIQNIFSVSMSVPMFIFDFRVYFFVYYIKNAQPTH